MVPCRIGSIHLRRRIRLSLHQASPSARWLSKRIEFPVRVHAGRIFLWTSAVYSFARAREAGIFVATIWTKNSQEVGVERSDQIAMEVQAELTRRRNAAAAIIGVLLVLTLALAVVAFFGKNLFRHQNNPSLRVAWMITTLTLGIGSMVWRRTKFSAMRLQDIAALNGATGLLRTLGTTTLQVAVLGAAISAFGFVTTFMTGDDFYTYRSALVGIVVLLYSYPTRASWQRALEKFVRFGPERPDPKLAA